jgi:hypothetical protein
MDDRRPSLRRVDQENLLKVRRDSKTRRPSLADVIPDWPALHKVKRPEKVNMHYSHGHRYLHLSIHIDNQHERTREKEKKIQQQQHYDM